MSILDEADGDENIEQDEDNEPWLAGDYGGFQDLERDDSEDEPSLGWSSAFNQALPDRFGRVDIVDGEQDASEMPEWDQAGLRISTPSPCSRLHQPLGGKADHAAQQHNRLLIRGAT
ncbi:hypothetical protein MesoLjLb_18860 [Mesorhizobium sp. L-8-3]|nr:hypothetical protein MesoLjLb_18860 [Mesorhizobium sp. L-8-3]